MPKLYTKVVNNLRFGGQYCFKNLPLYWNQTNLWNLRQFKQKEIENLEKYSVFEEVEDEGQERVGSRWVITRKEKANGQKQMWKEKW